MKTKLTTLLTLAALAAGADNSVTNITTHNGLPARQVIEKCWRVVPMRAEMYYETNWDELEKPVTNWIFPWVGTNKILDPSITLRLDQITNWTGVIADGKELGYVATNHVAVLYYQGATNEFKLKTSQSEIAKWRTNVLPWATNWIYWMGMAITNYSVYPLNTVTNISLELNTK